MSLLESARAAARRRPPWLVDGALAAIIGAVHVIAVLAVDGGAQELLGITRTRPPVAVDVALALLTTLPVAARRVRPDLVLAVVGLGMVVAAALGHASPGFGLLVALHAYAAHTDKDDGAAVLVVFGGFTVLSLVLSGGIRFLPLNLVVFATAWALGDAQRQHRLRTAELERRAVALEQERRRIAELAATQERSRIAGELHDVIAHGVTGMLVQATGAERLIGADPGRAVGALAEAERAGRTSLAELRRLLGVLRSVDTAVDDVSRGHPEIESSDATALPAARRRVTPRVVDVVLVALAILVDLSLLALMPAAGSPGSPGSRALGAAVLVLAALPLLVRRHTPVVALAACMAGGLLTLALGVPSQQFASLAALHAVAVRCSRRTSLLAVAALGGAIAVVATFVPIGPIAVQLAIIATAWLLGDAQRAREAAAAALADRTRVLLADRDRAGLLAAAGERARIARDLHDVVARTIGAMVVQAGAARRSLPDDPETAATATDDLVTTGRRALVELRALLGLLGSEAAAATYAPQPGLAAIDDLLSGLADSAVQVQLTVSGAPRPLPSGIDLSAYRIVEESLANVIRHAAARSAEVTLAWEPRALRIVVADDGRGPVDRPASAAGHGLVGMRERAALVGGMLTTAARPGGGFVVAATLPTED
jgi:signal transduction histidine kinase